MMALCRYIGEAVLMGLVPLLVPGIVIRLVSRVTQ
jgi:hypothetical protein